MEVSRVLVMSDSHGRNVGVLAALGKEKPIDLLVHLGDVQGSTEEIEKAAGCSCFFVRGNCDYDPNLPAFTVFFMGKHKVFAAHGHRYQVSYGTESLELNAKQNGCDVAMYGHTHVPFILKKKDMLILNPGSISLPRQSGFKKTYMVLTMNEQGDIIPELKEL